MTAPFVVVPADSADLPPSRRDVRVFRSPRVPHCAGSASPCDDLGRHSSQRILASRHRLHVLGVDAVPLTAEVIGNRVIRQRPISFLEFLSVDPDPASAISAHRVSGAVLHALPDVTRSCVASILFHIQRAAGIRPLLFPGLMAHDPFRVLATNVALIDPRGFCDWSDAATATKAPSTGVRGRKLRSLVGKALSHRTRLAPQRRRVNLCPAIDTNVSLGLHCSDLLSRSGDAVPGAFVALPGQSILPENVIPMRKIRIPVEGTAAIDGPVIPAA